MGYPQTNKNFFFINIVIPSALAVILFTVTLFYFVIPAFENAMMDRKREMIKELTAAASSILNKYHKDEIEGLISREEAQQTAISRLQYLRYGEDNKDYFWITDTMPHMVMHPYRPELNGQKLNDFTDSHGKKMFVAFVEVAEKETEGGYVDYMWQWKDDSTHIVPKVSFVKKFEPWGWIIGTGIYIEDVKKEIAHLNKRFVYISILISLITALILLYIGRQSLQIERKRQQTAEALKESKEKYKSLVEASTEGLIMIINNQITFSNKIFQQMLEETSETVLSMSPKEILNLPNNLAEKIEKTPLLINEKVFESKLSRKNNPPLDIIVNISPFEFNNEPAIIISVKDLSSYKLIKEELFENKEKFKTLMDKLNVGLFRSTIDKKAKFIEANATALKIFGYPHFDSLSQKYILDLFVENSDKRSFRKNLLENGFVKNHIVKLKTSLGQTVIVSVSLVIVYDINKNPKYCDGIVEEVSIKEKENQTDALLKDYTAYAQWFYQHVKHFVQPLLKCPYNESLISVAQKMTSKNTSLALLVSPAEEGLGVLTDADIRSRACKNQDIISLKAHEVMSAPVISVSEEATLIEALQLFKTYTISHLLVNDKQNNYIGYVKENELSAIHDFLSISLIHKINTTYDFDTLKLIRIAYINTIIPLIETKITPYVVFNALSILSDALTKRIIELLIQEIGSPPADFCFITLGSEARKEQTLSTDQDNAIIIADFDKSIESEVKTYFNTLSTKICTALDAIGYTFCKGEIMAMNPHWCQSLQVWKNYFNKWINTGQAKDLLDINIFFDIRPVYGKTELVNHLQQFIFEQTKKNPAYLYHLAQNTQALKPQVGFWGNILLETAGAPPETVNIKEAIMPIVNFARIYALKHNCKHTETLQRLQFLKNNNILNDNTYNNITQAFEYLNQSRLLHQTSLLKKGVKADNLINTKSLSELDKTIIKKVLAHISYMLSKLGYDFKVTM